MLNKFQLSKYKLILVAKETLYLPEYKGATFRGGFGNTFKKVVCINKDKECKDCILKPKCIYSYIFETTPPVDTEKLRKSKDIPKPFIIEPPISTKEKYLPEEIFALNLILIGKAIDYLPYFIFTFKELGNIGIGKGREKYELTSLKTIKKDIEQEIYSHQDEMIKSIDLKITMEDILKEVQDYKKDELKIDFITPTRMKANNKYILIPKFYVFVRSLLSRISSLVYFHCNEELKVDFKQLLEDAKKIRIKERHTGWYDWERYSSRQDTRMQLGGILGNVTYAGNLKQFLPFIVLGKYVHVGKGTTFGLGKYEISKK